MMMFWFANEWSPRIYLDHDHKNFHIVQDKLLEFFNEKGKKITTKFASKILYTFSMDYWKNKVTQEIFHGSDIPLVLSQLCSSYDVYVFCFNNLAD